MEKTVGLDTHNGETETYQIEDGIRCQYGDGALVTTLILRDRVISLDRKSLKDTAGKDMCALKLPSGFASLVSRARCPVCLCNPGEDGIDFIILPCKHVYCNGCYQSWLTGGTHREFPVTCLADGCSRKLRHIDLISNLAPKEMAKLLRASLEDFVKSNRNRFRLCEAPDCAGIIKNTGEAFSGNCSTCDSSFCFNCNASHAALTCRDYRLAKLPPDQTRIKIVEEILTLRCPRCKLAFLDFDGCFALSCSSCKCGFCGWCLTDCGSDAHIHVSSCTHKEPGSDQYHGTFEMFHVAQNKRRKKLLLSFLETFSPADKNGVIASIEQDLQDLGLQID